MPQSLRLACFYCAWDEPGDAAWCRRCGAELPAPEPGAALLFRLAGVRALARNRGWSRLAAELKDLEPLVSSPADRTPQVELALRWLGEDVRRLVDTDDELPRSVAVGRAVLRLLPADAMLDFRAVVDRLTALRDNLVATEESWRAGPASSGESLVNWLASTSGKSSLNVDEVRAFVYATPAHWPSIALALDPAMFARTSRRRMLSIGFEHLRKREYPHAKNIFQEVLAADGNSVSALEGLARALTGLKETAAAILLYRQAIRLGTIEFLTFNHLSRLLVAAPTPTPGELEEGVLLARRAVELAPVDLCYETLAAALGRQGKLAQAAAAWRDAIRCRPGHAPYRERLKSLCTQLDFSQGEVAAVESSENRPAGHDTLVVPPDMPGGDTVAGFDAPAPDVLATVEGNFNAPGEQRQG